MTSSDSEKTHSDEVYISENPESSESSSSKFSEQFIDDNDDVEVVVSDKPVKALTAKKSSKGKQPVNPSIKILKKWSSNYQEWVKAGEEEAPNSSSSSDINPKIKDAPYACRVGGRKTSRSDVFDKLKPHKLRVGEISRMPSLYYFDPSVPFRLPTSKE